MPANIFISFDHDDQKYIDGIRGTINNSNHKLQFNDHSLKHPVKNERGEVIQTKPEGKESKQVRKVICQHMRECDLLIVLIGTYTHQSHWVNWEIAEFLQITKRKNITNPDRKVLGIRCKGVVNGTIPILLSRNHVEIIEWDMDKLKSWIEKSSM